jgi:hypothetical protein
MVGHGAGGPVGLPALAKRLAATGPGPVDQATPAVDTTLRSILRDRDEVGRDVQS